MAHLQIRNVNKQYGDFVAVDSFSLDVADGEFVSLLGPSGCGKTTLLRSIAGFFPISGGEIRIGDRVVSSAESNLYVPPEKRNLGMVFQSYAVWPHMNVFQNIAYPLKVRGLRKDEIEKRVANAVSILNLAGQEYKNPIELSGGQQQRVALGRALVMDPDALLLDEPLSNLDAKLRDKMRFELKEIQRRLNLTIVYVTHDQDEAMAVSDRIVLMNKGKIQQVGSPRDIYQSPATLFSARFVGRSNFLRGTVESRDHNEYVVRRQATGAMFRCTPANEISLEPGTEVEAVLRYQHVRLADAATEFTVAAKVLLSTYLGGTQFYEFDSDIGLIISQIDEDVVLSEGDSVHLRFDRVYLFPAGE
jgi:iron(III) transport system ATP-binding protein